MFRLRLKELRENKGLSQYKLAEELQVSQARIGHWESGTRECDFATLEKLSKYFNVTVDFLLGITDSMYTSEDYANGVKDTKIVNITADEEDILDKSQEVIELLGEKGKELIIEFCNMILGKLGE